MPGKPASETVTLDNLVELREMSEKLSHFLAGRLKAHLDTLYPLIAPKRIFGKHIGAKETVPRADEAYAQLGDKFREAVGAPFELRSDLDEPTLSAMEHGIEVYPWEYSHEIGGKAITIASPVRWVVTYRSDYTLAQLRTLMAGKGERKALPLRQFVVNAIAMQVVLSRTPGLTALLQDLAYDVHVENGPGLGKLPLVTVGFPIHSFRPPDELIQAATRFSGVPAFIELVDTAAAQNLENPLGKRIEEVLAQ
jgi:hypothetical protein